MPAELTTLGRTERTTRILDAAAALLLRWGYQRVTVDDIATEAAVGTGTIYLHWRTKESLFESVLLRELQQIWGELAQRLRDDPAEALLHRCLRALLQAVKERPLARALFTRDRAMLGKLTQGRLAQQGQGLLGAESLLATLRRLGLLRTDLPSDLQAHAFSAIWAGFVLVDSLLGPADQAPLSTQLDALTQVVRDTFEPETLPDPTNLREVVAPELIALFEQARDQVARQIAERAVS
jgi:AcrR family transcriptional regulator